MIPSTERSVLRNKKKFVCLFLTGSKERSRQGYYLGDISLPRGVIRCGELKFKARLSRKLVGPTGINENQLRKRSVFLG